MQKSVSRQTIWTTIFYLVVIGFGVGWLAGLSVSPVVSIVITSITGAAAAIIAALAGVNEQFQENKPIVNASPLPLAILVVGILVGSALGIRARNEHWFGSDVSNEIEKWTSQGIKREEILDRLFQSKYPYLLQPGTYTTTINTETQYWTGLKLPQEEVVHRLFDRIYPATNTSTTTKEDANSNSDTPLTAGTSLFSVNAQECDSPLAAVAISDKQKLRVALTSSTNRKLRELPNIVTDEKVLHDIVEKFICAKE